MATLAQDATSSRQAYQPETWEQLERRSWAYTSEHLTALGHHFRIRTTHDALGRFLDGIFQGLRAAGAKATEGDEDVVTYSFVTDAPAPWFYALYVDSQRAVEHQDPAYVLEYLLWHLNQQVISGKGGLVLVHAAGLVRDGVGVILAAESEAGKTTLAAGLVRRGFDYLTDEAVAIRPENLALEPFAKPLSIDRGSWHVLADLEPDVEEAVRPFLHDQWQVPATAIRAGALARTATPSIVIVPAYRDGSTTELTPVSRAEMLVKLVSLSFDFRADPRRNLDVLRRVVSASDCYRLAVGDLDRACELVEQCVTEARTSARDPR
jgi:hypothetical protein